jgi:sulfoxide reductase heme-binding subunit YedZ
VNVATVWWGLDRGAGLAALALLTAATVLGTIGAGQGKVPGFPRFALGTLHRNLSLLVLVFGGIHAVTAAVDRFVDIRLIDLVVPFASPTDPFWTGLGTFGLDLMLAVLITSGLRRRLGPATWRAVHWLAYPCWAVVLLHAVGQGSDLGGRWGIAVLAGGVGVMASALAFRLGVADEPGERPASPAPAPAEPARTPPAPPPAPAPAPPRTAVTHEIPAPLWSSRREER